MSTVYKLLQISTQQQRTFVRNQVPSVVHDEASDVLLLADRDLLDD